VVKHKRGKRKARKSQFGSREEKRKKEKREKGENEEPVFGGLFMTEKIPRRRRGDERSALSILFDVFLTLDIGTFGTNLLVVLLEGSQVLPGLGELALFHAFSDVPVDESTF